MHIPYTKTIIARLNGCQHAYGRAMLWADRGFVAPHTDACVQSVDGGVELSDCERARRNQDALLMPQRPSVRANAFDELGRMMRVEVRVARAHTHIHATRNMWATPRNSTHMNGRTIVPQTRRTHSASYDHAQATAITCTTLSGRHAMIWNRPRCHASN